MLFFVFFNPLLIQGIYFRINQFLVVYRELNWWILGFYINEGQSSLWVEMFEKHLLPFKNIVFLKMVFESGLEYMKNIWFDVERDKFYETWGGEYCDIVVKIVLLRMWIIHNSKILTSFKRQFTIIATFIFKETTFDTSVLTWLISDIFVALSIMLNNNDRIITLFMFVVDSQHNIILLL